MTPQELETHQAQIVADAAAQRAIEARINDGESLFDGEADAAAMTDEQRDAMINAGRWVGIGPDRHPNRLSRR